MIDMTTVAILREDANYIKDLQYNIWKLTKRNIGSSKILRLILEYIKNHETDFLEYVKNKLSSQG